LKANQTEDQIEEDINDVDSDNIAPISDDDKPE